MSGFSNYTESGIIQHLFRSGTFAKPLGLAIAITRRPPLDAEQGHTIDEVPNSNNYARVILGAPSDSLFSDISQDALGSGMISNLSTITFNTSSGDWGWCSGLVITNSGAYGLGQVLARTNLEPAQYIGPSTTLSFSAGNLQFKID